MEMAIVMPCNISTKINYLKINEYLLLKSFDICHVFFFSFNFILVQLNDLWLNVLEN